VLEQWSDSPEMQRFAELYEDLIKCCCGDAMSEVQFALVIECYTSVDYQVHLLRCQAVHNFASRFKSTIYGNPLTHNYRWMS